MMVHFFLVCDTDAISQCGTMITRSTINKIYNDVYEVELDLCTDYTM